MVDETLAMEKVKTLRIAEWNLSQEIQIRKINMGTIEDPKYFKLNEELRGIPFHIVEHKIEVNTTIPPSHQVHYCMNPNYAMVVK